ncbi:MAG: NAD(P)/FAD-dependent oxidoreductase [Acidimicrobiales bacterium]
MEHHEVIIIGAGLTGIAQLYKLKEHGFDTLVLEAGSGLGGTWYFNRYPGCRFDSESWSYGYSFSKELLEEWDWTEHFSPQPENLRYLNYVADKFDLKPHVRSDSKVESATWDEEARTWTVQVADGATFSCRWLITAIGILSTPVMPRIEGIERFKGPWWHTYHWPQEPVDLAGKRVAVIGTGATAVQLIAAIAGTVGELKVFQRRPNWCAPLHNAPIPPEEMAEIRARYDEIFEQCNRTAGGFIHGADPRKMVEVPEQERYEFWEQLYASPGFGIWLGNFRDVLMDERSNEEFSAFLADKIRSRVKDPRIAEKLIPTDHGFGMRRVPMETNYYEVYNQDNVELVDLNETPIECVTETGIRVTGRDIEVDLIVYATGFDAVQGAFDRIDFIGVDDQKLRERWDTGPITYFGIQTHGFPNLLMLTGPQSGSGNTNFGRGVEDGVFWLTDLLLYLREHGHTRIENTEEAEQRWVEHVRDMYDMLLLSKTKSWFTGYNSNIGGRDTIRYVAYNGGAPRYRKRLAECAAKGYEGFVIS